MSSDTFATLLELKKRALEGHIDEVRAKHNDVCVSTVHDDLGRVVDDSVHLFEEWGLPIWKTDADGVRGHLDAIAPDVVYHLAALSHVGESWENPSTQFRVNAEGTLNVVAAEAGGTIQYSTNGGSTWTSSWTAVEGANSVQVRQTDVAGNVSAATTIVFTLDTTAAAPGVALAQLWQTIGGAETGLRVVAVLTLLVGMLGMCVALYASLESRRREMAILRAVGAGPERRDPPLIERVDQPGRERGFRADDDEGAAIYAQDDATIGFSIFEDNEADSDDEAVA